MLGEKISDTIAMSMTKFFRFFVRSLPKDMDTEQLFWKPLQGCLGW